MRGATHRCLIIGLTAWVSAWIYSQSYPYPLEQTLWFCRLTGYTTLGLLFGSLSVTPLRKLASLTGINTAWLQPYRRSLGITAFTSALIHACFSMAQYFGDAPWFMPLLEPFLRLGVLTLGILAVLWLTSFPKWVRALRLRTWRELHWLAYAAGLSALMHVLLSPFAPVRFVLAASGIWMCFAMLRLLPKRR